MNKVKYLIKILFFVILILLSIFLFVYGGYDDSPGAQLIGLLVLILSIVALVKIRKKNSDLML
jgi:hypothetical protein